MIQFTTCSKNKQRVNRSCFYARSCHFTGNFHFPKEENENKYKKKQLK